MICVAVIFINSLLNVLLDFYVVLRGFPFDEIFLQSQLVVLLNAFEAHFERCTE